MAKSSGGTKTMSSRNAAASRSGGGTEFGIKVW